MRNLGLSQIILVIVFIVVPLIQFVMQRVQRRREDQIPEHKSVSQMRRQPQPARTPPQVSASTTRNQVRGSQEPTVSTRSSTSHVTERSILGAQRDVRRGIIIMAVLGPCRAFDPPG